MADNCGCAKNGHSRQSLDSHTCNTQYYATKIEIYIVLYVCKESVHSKFCNMCCGLNERQNGYWQITVAVQKAVAVQCLVSLTCNTEYYITKIEIYIVLYVCKELFIQNFVICVVD